MSGFPRQNLLLPGLCLALLAGSAFGQSTNPALLEQYAEQGQSALAAGRYQEAQSAYEKLRELQPGVAEVHANLGLIYYQERRFDQAVPALRQALKLKPSLATTDSLLAASLSELGHYSEALPGLERGFRRGSDPEIKRMCGLQLLRAYTALRQDRKAVDAALELSQLFPDDPEVLYHTGKIFGNFAFLAMQKMAQVAPKSVWRHQTLAEASESQGAYEVALSEYRQVLALDPRRIGIHYRLGRVLLARSGQSNSQEDAAAAMKEFAEELEIDPANANAAYELAEVHRTAGEMEDAERFFRLALRYYPEFAEANLGLAAVLAQKNQPDLARPLLRKAIAANPENEVAWYRLAQAERALGNAAEQQKAFAEFQRLHKKAAELEADKGMFSPTEDITKQRLDANPAP